MPALELDRAAVEIAASTPALVKLLLVRRASTKIFVTPAGEYKPRERPKPTKPKPSFSFV
jgi:hypothetical protein